MSKIEKRIIVDGSTERVFAYVPERSNLPEIWPGLLEVGEVEHLPGGGAIARWVYKMTGVRFEDMGERFEPLVNRNHPPTVLGDIACVMKWSFQPKTHRPRLALDGDHTYWSQC